MGESMWSICAESVSVTEKETEMEEKKGISFDKKMVQAQKHAKNKNWKCFKKIFNEDRAKLLEPFDLFGNTAIHAVARSGSPQLLRELLEMLPEHQKKEVARKPNLEGNTLLHEAIFQKDLEMASAIINFEKQNGCEGTLLEQTNKTGETPPSRAARFGKLKMLKHMAEHAKVQLQSKHFPRVNQNKLPILHICVLGLFFEVAIWLVTKVDHNLTQQKDEQGMTCLHLLSRMPTAFKSKATQEMGTIHQLIYNLLPEKQYDESDDGCSNVLHRSRRDIESGQSDDETENPPKTIISRMSYVFWEPLEEVISRINYVFWKRLAKVFNGIHKIWEEKRRHIFAMHLVNLLVKSDNLLLEFHNFENQEPKVVVLPHLPSNVTEKRKELDIKAKMEKKQRIKEKNKRLIEQQKLYTPLLLAAASGIIEMVKKIIEENPEAISQVNKDGLNILHMAVRHRQQKIFEYIKRSAAFKSLLSRKSMVDRTILHQAASMEYYREQALPGVAYQLQDELVWFDQVRTIIPKHYLIDCDEDGLTAGDLLDIEHAEMHDQAKVWMKETAQSCSTVAVLIAGVVFAAAYAIPGGNEGGTPVLHHSPAFRFFTTMDVVALACSLGSVVMFLSILTSSFDLWDFHKSLPRKLKLGFLMLFFSLISTMLAFAATILLTIRMEGNKKKTTFIYSLAFVIVSIFGLTQFPLYKMFQDQIKKCLQLWKTLKAGCK